MWSSILSFFGCSESDSERRDRYYRKLYDIENSSKASFVDFENFINKLEEDDKLSESSKSEVILQTYYILSDKYVGIGQKEQAISYMNKAIDMDVNDAMSYYNRGYVYKEFDMLEQAISDYTKALSIKSDYVDAYYNRGCAYQNQKQNDKAIADFQATRKYVEGIPNYVDIIYDSYLNEGNIYSESGNIEEAIRILKKAIDLLPMREDAYDNLGNSYFAQGNVSDAASAYNQAYRQNPSQGARYTFKLGMLYEAVDTVQAKKLYNQVIQLDSRGNQGYRDLAKERLEAL